MWLYKLFIWLQEDIDPLRDFISEEALNISLL